MGVSSESLKTYFAHLVDVARGDKQRGSRAEAPRNIPAGELDAQFSRRKISG
jgi:hypothetical protein